MTNDEPGQAPAEQIERKIDWIVRELDELCAMANHPETVDLVDSQRVGVGQIISRATLIGAFLMNRKRPTPTPGRLQEVQRG